MNIVINNNGRVPIYEQIKNQIKEGIIRGVIAQDEFLPSIRGLSKEIGISVMTIKKAYDELEKEGFIITVPGKGSFVNLQNIELLREEKMREIEIYLEKAIDIAKSLNITKEEILNHYLYLVKGD